MDRLEDIAKGVEVSCPMSIEEARDYLVEGHFRELEILAGECEAHLDLIFTCPECGQPITPDDFLRWLRGGEMCPGKEGNNG